MTLEDQLKLKALIESALAESVAELKPGPRGPNSPTVYQLPRDQEWALVRFADCRALLTDRAVKALGGSAFSVVVSDFGVTIAAVAATPNPPPPAKD